jgi:hypothetical protein
MITEPPTGWAKNALQEFETLYIGGAEPAVVRRGLVGYELAKSRFGQIKTMRDCEGKLTTTMARIVWGRVYGTSTRLNDE